MGLPAAHFEFWQFFFQTSAKVLAPCRLSNLKVGCSAPEQSTLRLADRARNMAVVGGPLFETKRYICVRHNILALLAKHPHLRLGPFSPC